jgi:NAD(P)-dependent dehydrogenase (short-subunit alcohol dehydrogenase family)
MKLMRGTVAAITGAGSGIGRALALNLAGRGCALAIADIQRVTLEETVELARTAGAYAVSAHVCDVSNYAAVERFAADAHAAHGGVQLLVNNAGVALGGTFQDISIQDFHWLMGINFWGVVNGCKAFLPTLLRQDEAHIVNVSSVFGLLAPPGQTAYVSSKYAVRGFTESLRLDLHDTAVRVSAVHPGGVATNIARNARMGARLRDTSPERLAQERTAIERMLTLPPDRAAAIIVAGIERNRRRILVGKDAERIALLTRWLPLRMIETGMLRQLDGHRQAAGPT